MTACTGRSGLYHVTPFSAPGIQLFHIGPHKVRNSVLLAPMAGYSDLPFRELAWEMGAGLVVSEMITSQPQLWCSDKSLLRNESSHNTGPRVVQIEGAEPGLLAAAAIHHVGQGADIIDINMGCPVKKVCSKAAGSALLRDEALVARILTQVVTAVDVPVTLKTRTGWSPENRNGLAIARIAEASGIQALTVHGRTRACHFKGSAEYDTIADIKRTVSIPVIANGDITTPEQAKNVLDRTEADAVMIGRAAWGAPWLLGQIATWLDAGESVPSPSTPAVFGIMQRHLQRMHEFYGTRRGVRIARKHIKCYLERLDLPAEVIRAFNRLEDGEGQQNFLQGLERGMDGKLTMIRRSKAA